MRMGEILWFCHVVHRVLKELQDVLGSNTEGCTSGETSISKDGKGHFVLVQVEGLELFHDSEKGGHGAESGIGRCSNESMRLVILAILLFKPSEFHSMHEVRLCKCCSG